MKRREFITLLGGAAVSWPLEARAQQPSPKVWRIGILEATPREMNGVNLGALQKGLREHGYIEGTEPRCCVSFFGRSCRPVPEIGVRSRGHER